MITLAVLIYSLSQNIEIKYACKDQHVDATFSNYSEAIEYVEYFKPHHHYEIVPIITYERNNNNRRTR